MRGGRRPGADVRPGVCICEGNGEVARLTDAVDRHGGGPVAPPDLPRLAGASGLHAVRIESLEKNPVITEDGARHSPLHLHRLVRPDHAQTSPDRSESGMNNRRLLDISSSKPGAARQNSSTNWTNESATFDGCSPCH